MYIEDHLIHSTLIISWFRYYSRSHFPKASIKVEDLSPVPSIKGCGTAGSSLDFMAVWPSSGRKG